MWYEWMFSGIGTEVILLVTGIVVGILGEKIYQKYINIGKQKSGDNSIQIISSSSSDSSENIHISKDVICGDRVIGNKAEGDINVFNVVDEFDIRRISNMSNLEIERVIDIGNDATVRKWCLELILTDRQEYLIKKCIKKMSNDQEKLKLLKELIDRDFISSEYCRLIEASITNNVCLLKIIEMYILLELGEYLLFIFSKINSNEYIFQSLKLIYPFDKRLFKSLYNEGKCFDNKCYISKMEEWIYANPDINSSKL